MNVQSYILNISAILSIEELKEMVNGSYAHSVEIPLLVGKHEIQEFIAPKWITQGDIVFFYHAAKSSIHNKRLHKEISNGNFDDAVKMSNYLNYCDKLYDKYGGKIYAIGVVSDTAFNSYSEWEHPNYRTRIFAPIKGIEELDYPISLKEFEEFIPILNQKIITPVFGEAFTRLKSLVCKYNKIEYLERSTSVSCLLKDIGKGTWIKFANEKGRKYINKTQFRKYYVNFLLASLADDGKIYSDINCIKSGKVDGTVSNVILFGGAYIAVEIEMDSRIEETKLIGRLKRFFEIDEFENITDDPELIWNDFLILIDKDSFYIYEKDDETTLFEVLPLDDIRSMADVRKLKSMIFEDSEVS